MRRLKTVDHFKVLIPDGESDHSLSVIRCLGEVKNIEVIVLSNNKSVPIRFSRYCSRFITYSEGNSEEEKLNELTHKLKELDMDVVLPVDIKTISFFSKHKERISELATIAPLPDLDSFLTSNDKWLLALWLEENNIPYPNTIQYDANIGFQNITDCLTFPILIKPRLGSGGEGIKVFDDALNLEVFLKDRTNNEEIIIQSFINGYDIDCSVLCNRGKIIAHTIQKGFDFEPNRIALPSGIEFLLNDKIYDIVKKMVEKFNWSGIMHIDMRYDEEIHQYKVIEINPRFWASVVASIFAGVNFPYLACLTALKKNIPDINLIPKRVVRSKKAFNMYVNRVLYKKQKDKYLVNSYFEINIKDPMPEVYKIFKIFYII